MACPVCFGSDDPLVRESVRAGVGVLLGVTGIVLGCFATFFVRIARRAREHANVVGVLESGSHEMMPGLKPGPAEVLKGHAEVLRGQ